MADREVATSLGERRGEWAACPKADRLSGPGQLCSLSTPTAKLMLHIYSLAMTASVSRY